MAGDAYSAIFDPTALAESGAQLVAGAINPVVQGAAGVGAETARGLIPEALQPIPIPSGADVVGAVGEAMSTPPETEHGKALAAGVQYPFEVLGEGAKYAGGKTFEATGSPLAATAVETGIQAIPFILPGLKGRARVAALDGVASADAIIAETARVPPAARGELAVTPDMRVPEEVAPRVEPVEAPAGYVAAPAMAEPVPGAGPAPVRAADVAVDVPAAESGAAAPLPAPGETAIADRQTAIAEPEPLAQVPAADGVINASESAPELPPLYHGTKAGFEDFAAGTEGAASDPGVFGQGHYATSDPRLASVYAGKGEGANVRQVSAALENPKVFDSPQAAVEWQGERGTDSPEAAARVRAKYEAAGHDGVVIKNTSGKVQEVVAFKPEAFRSPHEKWAQVAPREEPAAAESVDDGPDFQTQRAKISDEIGWEERGGRMIRGTGSEKGFGDVVGRTPWVEKSDFWPRYRTNDPNPLTEREATEAFRKADAGEPLGKREQRFMDFAGEVAAERVNEHREYTLHQHKNARVADVTETRASVREAARAEAAPPPEELPNAGQVRSDTGPIRGEGRARAGSENARGKNLQRDAQAGESVPEPVRGGGKAGDDATPEVAPKEPGETGIYNAKVAEERARRGLEAVKHDLSRTDPASWESVQTRVDADPNYARSVTKDYAERPRPASKEDAIAIILDRQRIKNERRAAYDDAELSMDAGDADRAAAARQRIEDLDAEMETNDYAAKATGHEWAEAGRARQLMSRDDYSMAEMVRRAKAKKGAALSDAERTAVEKSAKRIEELETALAKAEEAARVKRARPKNPLDKADGKRRFDELAAELKKIRDADQMTPGCIV